MTLETKYERQCRVKFHELVTGLEHEGGYSKSQIGTVMVVMECDKDEAIKLLKASEDYYYPDWSQWTWLEFRDLFQEVKAVYA